MSNIRVEKAKEAAKAIGLAADFIEHEESGKTTEQAVAALGISADNILKTLILYSSKSDSYFGAIILGEDRLDIKRVAQLSQVKKLRLATPEQVEKLTGFQLGGVPPLAVTSCKKAFIDEKVVEKDTVVGAGGDEHCGMRFAPKELLDVLPLEVVQIST